MVQQNPCDRHRVRNKRVAGEPLLAAVSVRAEPVCTVDHFQVQAIGLLAQRLGQVGIDFGARSGHNRPASAKLK